MGLQHIMGANVWHFPTLRSDIVAPHTGIHKRLNLPPWRQKCDFFLQSLFYTTAVLPVHTEQHLREAFGRGRIKERNSNEVLQLWRDWQGLSEQKITQNSRGFFWLEISRISPGGWFRGFGVGKLASWLHRVRKTDIRLPSCSYLGREGSHFLRAVAPGE